jgi:sec-independent protein translocase protein TatA
MIYFVFLHGIQQKNDKRMMNTLLFMGLGMQEIIAVALIVLLLFGGKKIPELMKGLGKGVKSFKDGMNGDESSNEEVKSEE